MQSSQWSVSRAVHDIVLHPGPYGGGRSRQSVFYRDVGNNVPYQVFLCLKVERDLWIDFKESTLSQSSKVVVTAYNKRSESEWLVKVSPGDASETMHVTATPL